MAISRCKTYNGYLLCLGLNGEANTVICLLRIKGYRHDHHAAILTLCSLQKTSNPLELAVDDFYLVILLKVDLRNINKYILLF